MNLWTRVNQFDLNSADETYECGRIFEGLWTSALKAPNPHPKNHFSSNFYVFLRSSSAFQLHVTMKGANNGAQRLLYPTFSLIYYPIFRLFFFCVCCIFTFDLALLLAESTFWRFINGIAQLIDWRSTNQRDDRFCSPCCSIGFTSDPIKAKMQWQWH